MKNVNIIYAAIFFLIILILFLINDKVHEAKASPTQTAVMVATHSMMQSAAANSHRREEQEEAGKEQAAVQETQAVQPSADVRVDKPLKVGKIICDFNWFTSKKVYWEKYDDLYGITEIGTGHQYLVPVDKCVIRLNPDDNW